MFGAVGETRSGPASCILNILLAWSLLEVLLSRLGLDVALSLLEVLLSPLGL